MSTDQALLAALPQPGADGFAPLRKRARETFIDAGLPNRRDEAYKYTDLTPLGAEAWPRAAPDGPAPALPRPLGRRTLWVNGRLGLSECPELVSSLGALLETPTPALTSVLGQVAHAADPLVALNTSLFDHGAWIDVPEGEHCARPLELLWARSENDATPTATYGRLAVHLGRGSKLVLIERQIGRPNSALASRVAEIVVDAGAELVHLRLNEAGSGTWLLGNSAVRIGAGACYRYIGLDMGGKITRESMHVNLMGMGSDTRLAGLAVLEGRGHADSDVRVEHNAEQTRSRQFFRGVLDGRSRSAYTGRVKVAPGAQKSDAGQQSANLLLSRHAEADTRPQLEIYADDVSCSHGAATGAIDPEALFYLQSRAIPVDLARRMIAYGFAVSVLANLAETLLYQPLARLLADHLNAGKEVGEWL